MLSYERTSSFEFPMSYRKSVLISLFVFACLLQYSCGASVKKAFTTPGTELPIGSFDTPVYNATIKGNTLFGGWAAHPSGIDFIAMYVDGKYIVNASMGNQRPDVLKAFPQYKPEMVTGWDLYIDPSSWAPGQHSVVAKMVSKAGVDRDFTVNITVVK